MTGPLDLHPKVTASLIGGWITVLVLYALHEYAGIDPPAEVGAAVAGLITFACGWLAPTSTAEKAKR